MAFAQADSRQDAISEMNITPLVDVMLVIFMIAAPVFSQAIPLQSPHVGHHRHEPQPPIELRIDAAGEVFPGNQSMPISALPSVFSAELERAGKDPVVLRIDANGEADYQIVAKVLAAAQNAGLSHIRFGG